MTRSVLVIVVASCAAGLSVALAYAAKDGIITAGLVAAISGAALALAHALARRPFRHALGRRFSVAVAVAVGVVLAVVIAAVALMFVSEHDGLLVSAVVVAAALVGLRAAHVASEGVVREVEGLRDVLRAVADGERSPSAHAHSATELAELAHEANAMIARLGDEERRRDASDTARRNLVAAVSHDLRTPMTALKLMVDAIEDGLVDAATVDRYLASMSTHVQALGAMVDDLFELSRLEAGELERSLEQVELRELLSEAVAAMQMEARTRGVALAAELPPTPQPLRADAERLQRVLFNLIRNAIRHTPPDGSVTVRAERQGDGVAVEVADTGPGIDPADRERVFDAFVRGDAARTDGGAGLGLAISRAIVEAHGGRIWIADAPAGARVRFVIPA